MARKEKNVDGREVYSGRGGARKGAGRPKGDSRLYSFRCSGELARELDAKPNRTEFIRNSLVSALESPAVTNPPMVPRSQVNPGFSMTTGSPTVPRHPVMPGSPVISAATVAPLRIPYFDVRVRAGFPVPLDNDERAQDIELLSLLCPHPESSYLIRVEGDSMIDAGILSGDIVIVDKGKRNPAPKEIAVCELNGEYTLKHLMEEDGRMYLVPANPDFPMFPIKPEDEFSVWGTVTYIIHKAR